MTPDPPPELPVDPPSTPDDVPVDQDAVAAELGCVEYHRRLEENDE
jgi:hypothetical protein